MIGRREFLISSIAGSLGLMTIGQAVGADHKAEYRLSLVPPPGTLWHKTAEMFAENVRERTSGRINIKLYPGSALVQGQQDRELAALRQGAIDMIVGNGSNYSGTVKDLGVFILPFLLPDNNAIDALIQSSALKEDFYNIVRKAGMEPLASAEYGYMQLFNSKRRLATPADMAGLKVRVVATPMLQEVMNALGANPTSMPWAEAQSALASEAVDGVMLTFEQAVALKVHTMKQNYVLKWNAFTEILQINVANPIWASWTPEDQEIVRGAAQDAAKEITRITRAKEIEDEEVLRQAGVDVYTPTPEELEEWRTLVRQPYEKWKQIINPELVTKFEEVIANAAKGG